MSLLLSRLVACLSGRLGHGLLAGRLPYGGGGHVACEELRLLFISLAPVVGVVVVLRLHFVLVLLLKVDLLVAILVIVSARVVSLVVLVFRLVLLISSCVLICRSLLHVGREEKAFRHSLGDRINHISELLVSVSEAAHSAKFAGACFSPVGAHSGFIVAV